MNEFDSFDTAQFARGMCVRFKPGGGGDPPHAPRLGATGAKWAQKELYKTVERGMAGGGLLPFDRFGPMKKAYGEAHQETKPFLQSYLNRMVPKADAKVRDYAGNMLDRSYYGGLQDLREQERLAPYEEQQEAMNMAMQYLAGEKQMSANITDIYNQGQMAQAQMPTFGSQLGYGLGSAGGIMFANERFAQLMANQGGG